MYLVPKYSVTFSLFDKNYDFTINVDEDEDGYDDYDNEYAEVKASDVIPFNYHTDKGVKNYVNKYNNFLKKLKSNQDMGFKFKKDTTILVSPPHPRGEDELYETVGDTSLFKKRTVKKNKIIYVDTFQDLMDKTIGENDPDIIKYKGKYYYRVHIFLKDYDYNYDPYAVHVAYIPVDSIEFVVLDGSNNAVNSNYRL